MMEVCRVAPCPEQDRALCQVKGESFSHYPFSCCPGRAKEDAAADGFVHLDLIFALHP